MAGLLQGKVTLLTFFYTGCSDPLGCPFAFGVMHSLRARLSRESELARHVQMISVSLDPLHDTPPVLARYANGMPHAAHPRWLFLTTRSIAALRPVIEDFGQDVSLERDARGLPTRLVHHMLKMFLIDQSGEVREIYSLAYIQPPVINNDVRTLVLDRFRAERLQICAMTAGCGARNPDVALE